VVLKVAAGEIPMPWPFARKSPAVLALDVTETSSSPNTRFAFKLFRELAGERANVFFSPASVMLCLAMVYEAAAGETRQVMAQALELAGLDRIDVDRAIAALRAPFRRREHVEVMGANSLWFGDRVQVRPEYAAKVRNIYDADLVTVDFAAADAVARINVWVHEKTKGKISRIVDVLSPLTSLIAVNAIYFKGRWARPFERESTRDGLFTTTTGEKKQLPMMLQSGRYSYYEDHKLQTAVLPYEGDMAMHVILPAARTDPRQFRESLSSHAWELPLARFEKVLGTIKIPRFKLDFRVRLEPALKVLGMDRAFDQNRAEFDAIRTERPPVWIDQVSHRAVAEVNEEGTEAAAATAITQCLSARNQRPPRHFQMIVDRPFFVVIRDETSGTTLFMGWVGDPGCAAVS
jgi:serine protease inhibitor